MFFGFYGKTIMEIVVWKLKTDAPALPGLMRPCLAAGTPLFTFGAFLKIDAASRLQIKRRCRSHECRGEQREWGAQTNRPWAKSVRGWVSLIIAKTASGATRFAHSTISPATFRGASARGLLAAALAATSRPLTRW
jgi:hypothetical protein